MVCGKIDSNLYMLVILLGKINDFKYLRKKKQDKLDKNIINILSNINVDNTGRIMGNIFVNIAVI